MTTASQGTRLSLDSGRTDRESRKGENEGVFIDARKRPGRHDGVEHTAHQAANGQPDVELGQVQDRRPAFRETAVEEHPGGEQSGKVKEMDSQTGIESGIAIWTRAGMTSAGKTRRTRA